MSKVHLHEAMRAEKVTKSEVARRLDVHLPQVDRLLEMTHASKLDQIEAAYAAVGKRLVLGVEDVATPVRRRERRKRRVAGKIRAAKAVAGERSKRR